MFRHVGIVVNDLDKMKWFYQDVIGLEILYDKIEEGRFLNHILNSVNKSPRIIKLLTTICHTTVHMGVTLLP